MTLIEQRIKIFLDFLKSRKLTQKTYNKAAKSAINILKNELYMDDHPKIRKTSLEPRLMFCWAFTEEGAEFWSRPHIVPKR